MRASAKAVSKETSHGTFRDEALREHQNPRNNFHLLRKACAAPVLRFVESPSTTLLTLTLRFESRPRELFHQFHCPK